jgi:hypothetical protein
VELAIGEVFGAGVIATVVGMTFRACSFFVLGQLEIDTQWSSTFTEAQ